MSQAAKLLSVLLILIVCGLFMNLILILQEIKTRELFMSQYEIEICRVQNFLQKTTEYPHGCIE